MHNNAYQCKICVFLSLTKSITNFISILYYLSYLRIKGGDGGEEGILGVDLGCGLRRVGVRVEMKYLNQIATL